MTMEILTFGAAGGTWGIPLNDVREIASVAHVTRLPLAPDAVAGVVDLHGSAVVAVDFRTIAGAPSLVAQDDAIVLQQNVALLVDAVRSVVTAEELEPAAGFTWTDGTASGATIINVARLLEEALQ